MKSQYFIMVLLVMLLVGSASAWYSTYNNQITYTVTGDASWSGDQTGYQVLFTFMNTSGSSHDNIVYTNGLTARNWSDIAFTNLSDNLPLFYTIDDTNATSATVTVRVPLVNKSAPFTQINVYYGKTLQTSLSNGDSTYYFYDNFTATTLDTTKWQLTHSNGRLLFLDGAMFVYGGANTNYTQVIGKSTFGSGYALRSRLYTSHYGSTTYNEEMDFINYTTQKGQLFRPSFVGIQWGPKYNNYDGVNFANASITDWSPSTWHITEIRRGATSAKFQIDNQAQVTLSDYYYTTNGSPAFNAGYNADSAIVSDWVGVRKYVDVEPVLSTTGTVTTFTHTVSPVASFTTNVTAGANPLSVRFTDTSANGTAWNWSFGDGTYSSLPYPVHAYSSTGNKTVTLTVSNNIGSTAVTHYIESMGLVPANTFTRYGTDGTILLPNNWSWWNSVIGEPSILYDTNPYILTGQTNVYKFWFGGGWYPAQYGYGESTDGIHITMLDSPILTGYARNSIVKDNGNYYHYLAAYGDTHIDLFTSTNGVNISLNASDILVPSASGWDNMHVANTYVWNDSGTWKMLYEANGNSHVEWGIGLATAPTPWGPWTKYAGNPVISETGSRGGPALYNVSSDGVRSILVHGGTTASLPVDLYKYDTFDGGYSWTVSPATPFFSRSGADEGAGTNVGQAGDAWIMPINGHLYLYYSATPDGSRHSTGKLKLAISDSIPVSDFTATPVSGSSPVTVQFLDQSLYGPATWNWSFGDGTYSSIRNPSHTYTGTEYTTPSTYTISLNVTNSFGTNTTSKSNFISVTAGAQVPPSTSFTQSETHGTPPLTVQFTDTSSAYYHITGWLWNFGEGNTSTSQNPSHTFYGSGIYTVTLTTTNAYGSTSASSTVQTNGARVHPFTYPIKETPGYIYQTIEPYKSYLASIKSNADKGMVIDYTNYGVAAGFSDWKYARDMALYGYITGNTRYMNKSIEALLHTDRIHYAAVDKFEDAMVADAALAYDFVAPTLNQGNTTLDSANNTIIRNKLATWGNFMYRRLNVNGTDKNQIDVTDYMMESYVNTATVGEVLYDYTNSSLQTNATQWRACGSTDYFVNDTLHTPFNNYGMAAFTADRNFGTSWTGTYKYYYMLDGNTGGNGMYRWFNIYSNIYGSILDDYPMAEGLATEEAWTSMPNGYISNYGTDGNVKRAGTPMLYSIMNRNDRNITRIMYNRMNAATALPNSRWLPAGMYAFDLFMSYNEPALNAEPADYPSETNFFHKTNWRQILRGDWSTRSDWVSFITWNEPNVRQNRWPDHNDQLSFEYYSKGDYLLADSGEIKYLSANPYSAIYGYSAIQHNSILFGNGAGNTPFPNTFVPSVTWPATNGFNTTYAGLDKGTAGGTVSHADVDNIIETPYISYIDGKSTSNKIQSTPVITDVNIERSFLYPLHDYVVVIDRVNHLPRALDVINEFRLSSFNITKTTSASAVGYTHGDLSIDGSVYDWKNMPQNAELSTGITTNSIEWDTTNPYNEKVTLDLFSAPSSAVNIIKHPSQLGGYQGYDEEVNIPVIYWKQPTDTSMYRVTALLSRYTNQSPKTASELNVTGVGHAEKIVSADAQYSDYIYTGLGTSTFDSFTTDADTAFVRKVANITDYTFLNGTYLQDAGITKVQSTTRLKYLTYHKSTGGTAYVNISGSGSTNLYFYNLTGTPSSVTLDGATPTWGMVDATTLEITATLSEHQIIFNEAGSTDNLQPIADFEATPTSGTSVLPVSFTDKTLNFPASYSWAYKESAGSWTQFSTDPNPVQNFTTGVYDINLTVANSAGQNSKIMTVYITVTAPPAPPTASFTADGTSGAISFNVSFFDTSIGSPTLWYWEFGDGATSSLQNPAHIYTYNGTFNVNLLATNGAGSSWYNQSGYININSPDVGGGDVIGSFVSDVTSGISPLTVQFTDTSLGSPIGWNWYFGDGVWDNSTQNPAHTYSSIGTYPVFLIASNGAGINQSANTTITVTESNATPTPIQTQTSSAGIACPTSAIGSGIAILGVALIVLAVVLVVAAVSGVSSGASGRAESGGSNFNLLLAGIAIFMIGAILVTVSLVIIYPLLGATGC